EPDKYITRTIGMQYVKIGHRAGTEVAGFAASLLPRNVTIKLIYQAI
ncbi:hypothetical protein THAOC_21895, partial [Thalassiosira oceanica]